MTDDDQHPVHFSAGGTIDRPVVDAKLSTQNPDRVHVFIGRISLYGPLDDLHALATELLNQLTELVDQQLIRPARAVLGTDGSLRLETSTGLPLGHLGVGSSSGFAPGQDLLIHWDDDADGYEFVRWVFADNPVDHLPDGHVVVTVTAEAGGA